MTLENLQGSYEDDDEPDALQGWLLKYGALEEPDPTVYGLPIPVSPTFLLAYARSRFAGTWSGVVEGSGTGHGIFQVNFSVDPVRPRVLQGSGLDVNGEFEATGDVIDELSFKVTLKRQHLSTVANSIIPLQLSGRLNLSRCMLSLTWGTGQGSTVGSLVLYPGPAELTRFRTMHPRSFGYNITRSPAEVRWSFACSAILSRVRSKAWTWSHFKDRRDMRRDYTALYRRQYLLGVLEEEDSSKLERLENSLTPLDLRFYRSICRSHYSVCHHTCVIIFTDPFLCTHLY